MDLTADAMQKLAELFRDPEPEVLQGSDLKSTEIEISSTRNEVTKQDSATKGPRTIEEFEEEQAKEAELLAHAGGGVGDRKTPEYTMNYQQAVSAEDVFLQIGHKTPSSASCEHLMVKIKMPGDKMENVDLSVDTSSVTVNSSQFHLILPLPHKIDPDSSKANWDKQLETLILTLKLEREFDFVNF